MPNRSHYNSAHQQINRLRRDGIKHSSHISYTVPHTTYHAICITDAVEYLKSIPDSCIQLVLVDPPYNIELATWDNFSNYMDWSKLWINEIERILNPSGNFVIFGGFQYQDLKKGDLLEVMHYIRHHSNLRFVNFIIWYYKNGMSAHRFFANRHEEILWFSKTKKYYFDLDSVRIPYAETTKKIYKKDKRLNPDTVEKGKNPTNVWEINRLNANSKERVGHPTQKPLAVIRRLVQSLSYPGSLVLDFFAGSGTTGRVCIEENRNSLLVDNDPKLIEFHNNHLKNSSLINGDNKYELFFDISIQNFLKKLNRNSS